MKKSHSRPPLRQHDIDHGTDEKRPWLERNPGGWSTIILVIVFALCAWFVFGIWGVHEVFRMLSTAWRG